MHFNKLTNSWHLVSMLHVSLLASSTFNLRFNTFQTIYANGLSGEVCFRALIKFNFEFQVKSSHKQFIRTHNYVLHAIKLR